jgi:hypothetical protein
MDKDRDLLPWILGGLSMATVAIAIIAGSQSGTAPKKSSEPSPATAYALPRAPAQAVPAAAPVPAPNSAAAQIQTATPPIERSSQVWECTINGEKTFSDHPCGEKASLRTIGPINTMDPTPLFRSTPSYGPPSSYAPEYPYPSEQQFADNSYPVYVGIPFREHRRPDRAHHGQDRGRGSRNH